MDERKSIAWTLSESQDSDQSTIAIDKDGSVYLIDSSHESTHITKYSPDHKTLYSKYIQYLTRGCTFMDAKVSNSGDIYAVGSRYNYNLSYQMPVVVRISPDGNVLDTYSYDQVTNGEYNACFVNSDDSFYAVGTITVADIERGILVKMDNSGNVIWEHVLTDSGLNGSALHGVVTGDSDRYAYVVGTCYNGYNAEFGFVAMISDVDYRSSEMVWLSKVNTEGYTNRLKGITITPDGDIYAVGTVNEKRKNIREIELDGSIMGLVIELSNDGVLKWQLGVKSGDTNSFDAICTDAKGNLIIVGGEIVSVDFDDVNHKGKHIRRHKTYSSGTVSVIQANNELTLYYPVGYDLVSTLSAVVCDRTGKITAIGHHGRYERYSVINSIGDVASFRMSEEMAKDLKLSTPNISLLGYIIGSF